MADVARSLAVNVGTLLDAVGVAVIVLGALVASAASRARTWQTASNASLWPPVTASRGYVAAARAWSGIWASQGGRSAMKERTFASSRGGSGPGAARPPLTSGKKPAMYSHGSEVDAKCFASASTRA